MITIQYGSSNFVVKPTIFPDATSQCWKLPEEVLDQVYLEIVWNFEEEREIIDVLSLKELLGSRKVELYIPYLPYARQDKVSSNHTTFNLNILADILNTGKFNKVSTFDAHNPDRARELIHNFVNIKADSVINDLIERTYADYLVYPDTGAKNRYKLSGNVSSFTFEKTRNQQTGEITGHRVVLYKDAIQNINIHTPNISTLIEPNAKVLLIDDLCDGGATFISIAKMLREAQPNIHISLYVTHGVFSKGEGHLLNNGINKIFTTNSLIKNKDGIKV